MPNWVYNNISVRGTKEDLLAFHAKASKIAPSGFTESGELEYKDDNAQAISFWNFIEPENKTAYFEAAHGEKPEGYAEWSFEEKMTYDLAFKSDGWYDWNVRNWGTKWDACDANYDDNTEDENPNLYYAFNTAWSIPEQIYQAITEQHPELDFDFYGEEEQGWGAEYKSSTADNGERSLELTEQWDIPDCHEDYVKRGRECNCEHETDEEYWYEDCPRKSKDFVVIVERRYIVKATDAEKAWEITQETLDELTPEDLDSFRVVDENTGEHLFPVMAEVVN